MKAVRLHDVQDLRVEDVAPPPPPPAGYVNLRVRAAGICGSDLHNYMTGQWISRRPSTAGHEFCGEVIAVGDGVTDFQIGDYVSVDSRVWCGDCPACRGGRPMICEQLGFVGEVCDGGFAEQVQLPTRLLVKHDRALRPHIAAMAEPLAVALHAVRRLALPKGEPVLVIGCGTIGGLAALLLSRLHDRVLMLADRNAERQALVAEVTGARPITMDRFAIEEVLGLERLRYALDATGNVEAIRAGLELMSGGGNLALVGIGHGLLNLDPNDLVEREIGLIGCHAFNDELSEAVAMLPSLADALDRFCEPIASLDDIPATYERLIRQGSPKLKAVVELE